MTKSASELLPVYLIVSEQDLLVDEALARLKARVGDAADLDFNMQVFSGESATSDDIVVACNTMPFASDKRLVVVRGVERLAKDSQDALAAYVADPAPFTVLAIAGTKLAKNTRLYKAVDRVGGVVDRKVEKRDVPGVVRRMFEAREKVVTRDGAEELVSAVGYDLRRLSAEIDKAVAYVGERREVTREDIENVTATSAPTNVWEYTEALGDRDCRRSLARLADLLAEGESVHGLHALGVRTIRDLIAARCMLDRGRSSTSEVATAMGRPDWQVKRLVRQARAFRADELARAIRLAAAAEAEMKTSRDSRLVLERWIVQLCG